MDLTDKERHQSKQNHLDLLMTQIPPFSPIFFASIAKAENNRSAAKSFRTIRYLLQSEQTESS